MSRGARTILVLVVALAAAGAASFVVYRAVQQIPVREVEVRSQKVVVAAKPLPVGALLGETDVKLVDWPARSLMPGALLKSESAIGRGLVSAVGENEPITETKLASREAGAGLPPTIPPGMRAISVKVDEVVGVAGFVVPGTFVDVVVTVRDGNNSKTRTVVSGVRVLTAGTRYDEEEARKAGKPIPSTVVTLLAMPQDVERIALASANGKVILALRNPLDTVPTVTPGINLASLTGPPSAPPVEKKVQGRRVMAAPPAPAPVVATKYTIETYRAGKRTEQEVKEDKGK